MAAGAPAPHPIDAARGWGYPNRATPPGSAAYYALRFAPARLRDDLATCHGWRHVLRAIPDEVTDPGVAAAKLAWWRDELRRCFEGAGRQPAADPGAPPHAQPASPSAGQPPIHPLGERLASLIARTGLPVKPFLDMAWSTEAVLARRWPKDDAELAACNAQDLGALFELELRLQAPRGSEPDAPAIARARRLGAYCAQVEQLRDAGLLLRRGRIGFVPESRARAAGITRETLAAPDGRHHLPRLAADMAAAARDARTREPLDGLPASIRIRVDLDDRLLAELEATGFDLVDQRIALTPIRKLWHAWRERRRSGP